VCSLPEQQMCVFSGGAYMVPSAPPLDGRSAMISAGIHPVSEFVLSRLQVARQGSGQQRVRRRGWRYRSLRVHTTIIGTLASRYTRPRGAHTDP
jgi:hypothetical protein